MREVRWREERVEGSADYEKGDVDGEEVRFIHSVEEDEGFAPVWPVSLCQYWRLEEVMRGVSKCLPLDSLLFPWMPQHLRNKSSNVATIKRSPHVP